MYWFDVEWPYTIAANSPEKKFGRLPDFRTISQTPEKYGSPPISYILQKFPVTSLKNSVFQQFITQKGVNYGSRLLKKQEFCASSICRNMSIVHLIIANSVIIKIYYCEFPQNFSEFLDFLIYWSFKKISMHSIIKLT